MNTCPANQFGCGGETKCRARINIPKPSYSRVPGYLALAGIVLFAALGIWAGGAAMDRVERVDQMDARR